MTQAQLDLQNQLEQTKNTDLTTQPLFSDSPVLFLEVMDQAPSLVNTEKYLLNIRSLPKNIIHLQNQTSMTNLLEHLNQIIMNNFIQDLNQTIMNNLMEHLLLQKSARR